jgi:hypothetical protein
MSCYSTLLRLKSVFVGAKRLSEVAKYVYCIFQAKELEDFCFKFSLNHMTAVTQTEAFSKLDEGTVKDFITKVTVKDFYHQGAVCMDC